MEARVESRSVLLQSHTKHTCVGSQRAIDAMPSAANSRERTVRWPGPLGRDAALRQVVGRVIRRQNGSLSQPAIWFGVDTVSSENPLK